MEYDGMRGGMRDGMTPGPVKDLSPPCSAGRQNVAESAVWQHYAQGAYRTVSSMRFEVWRLHFGGLEVHFGGPGGVLEALWAHLGHQEGSGMDFCRF